MKIFEGNLITPLKDYKGKCALSTCGNVVSDDFNGKEGWFIVEPVLGEGHYINGVLVSNIEQKKENKINELKTLASEIILKKYPEFKQINASLGIYSEEQKTAIINFINAIRINVTNIENQINLMFFEELINFKISKEDLLLQTD